MSALTVIFRNNDNNITLQLKDDMMFCEAALMYLQKSGIDKEKDDPKFLYNSREIKIDSYKTLKELKIPNRAIIEVILAKNIIGA